MSFTAAFFCCLFPCPTRFLGFLFFCLRSACLSWGRPKAWPALAEVLLGCFQGLPFPCPACPRLVCPGGAVSKLCLRRPRLFWSVPRGCLFPYPACPPPCLSWGCLKAVPALAEAFLGRSQGLSFPLSCPCPGTATFYPKSHFQRFLGRFPYLSLFRRR